MKFSKQFQLYESDHTKFIKALKLQNPELDQQQRDGRALLWDKEPIDLDTQKRTLDANVPQQAYVYQNKA
jgi:hypothetical protein